MPITRSLLLASCLIFAASAARGESVGNVGAVNQSAQGTPPSGASRALSVGLGVENRERIVTSAEGNAQIVFRDSSAMTIGRGSAVTIDRFVYDANSGAGGQGVSLAKGVLRFVGGGVSHGVGADVKTPTASIGVRGGTALVSIGGPCATLVVLQYGVATVSNATSSIVLTRPGYGVCVPSLNGPIPEAFAVSEAVIADLAARLGSGRRQTGGVELPPDNIEAHRQLSGLRPPNDLAAPGSPSLAELGAFWAGDAFVQSCSNANNQPLPPIPVVEEQPPPYQR